ncbi:MAG: sensor histidine kinase [Gemmatimonas sp.]|nr:histidine kinase [Gemmatimonas sp.]MCE2953314.1 histidine kinase [Gemmatimonas sp.]
MNGQMNGQMNGHANGQANRRSVLARISRGELLSLLGVGVFGELLTVAWIAAVLGVEKGQATWAHALGLAAVDLVSLMWVPVPLFAWYDRFPLAGDHRQRNLLLRAVGALALILVTSFTSAAATRWAGDALGIVPAVIQAMLPGYPEQVFWAACPVLGASLAYLVLRRLHNARDVEQRNAELQRLALEAQLSALAAELRPHFLFNALNDLAELVHHDPARAETMLLHLSSLLQATLAAGRQRTVSLAEELQHMDDYLALQQMRFDDRLQVTRAVDASVLAARVPPMLLQPLVENAVVHGIEGRVGASQLQLTVRARPGTLEVQLDDDGPGPTGSAHRGTGTGLRNVRERLAALYGEAAEAVLSERPGGGARMLLRLPLEVA